MSSAWPSSSSASVALWRQGVLLTLASCIQPPQCRASASFGAAVWFPCPACPCSGVTLGEKFPLRSLPYLQRALVERNLTTGPGKPKPASGQRRSATLKRRSTPAVLEDQTTASPLGARHPSQRGLCTAFRQSCCCGMCCCVGLCCRPNPGQRLTWQRVSSTASDARAWSGSASGNSAPALPSTRNGATPGPALSCNSAAATTQAVKSLRRSTDAGRCGGVGPDLYIVGMIERLACGVHGQIMNLARLCPAAGLVARLWC